MGCRCVLHEPRLRTGGGGRRRIRRLCQRQCGSLFSGRRRVHRGRGESVRNERILHRDVFQYERKREKHATHRRTRRGDLLSERGIQRRFADQQDLSFRIRNGNAAASGRYFQQRRRHGLFGGYAVLCNAQHGVRGFGGGRRNISAKRQRNDRRALLFRKRPLSLVTAQNNLFILPEYGAGTPQNYALSVSLNSEYVFRRAKISRRRSTTAALR